MTRWLSAPGSKIARDVIEASIGRHIIEAGLSVQDRGTEYFRHPELVPDEQDHLFRAARLRICLKVLDELVTGEIRHEVIKLEP